MRTRSVGAAYRLRATSVPIPAREHDIRRGTTCVDEGNVYTPMDASANSRGDGASHPEPSSTLSSPRMTLAERRAAPGSDHAREQPMQTPESPSDNGRARLQRMKSWGAARIDRWNAEARDGKQHSGRTKNGRQTWRRVQPPGVPFFSKLGYILTFGEPIAEENVHLFDAGWVEKVTGHPHWWVIHPFSSFRRSWDINLMLALTYVALCVPFVIGFEVQYDKATVMYVVDRIVDCFFILDVVFNFFTGYTSHDHATVVMEPGKIARHYTRTWLVFDLVASVPIDLMLMSDGEGAAYRGTKFVRVMKLLRLVKLFRMLRLNRILHRLERKMSIKYGLWQVIKFACVVLCLGHWLACAWYLMHTLEIGWGDRSSMLTTPKSTWVDALAESHGTEPLYHQSRWSQYMTCVYWAMTTMTTIGYGDIVPSNVDERVLTVFAELMGSSVFLYGLTQVTGLIANINSSDVEFQKLMDVANEYFEFRQIPVPLRLKVREFFHYKRASSLFYGEKKLLAHVSDDIRAELQMWSLRRVLNKTPFLRDANEKFVKLIVHKLTRKIYGPREVVIREGDIADEMYFVAHGEVEVLVGRTRIAYLDEGAMIGEIAVAMKTRRTATVRTVTFTELLALHRSTFQRAARAVPETADAMIGYAVRRLRQALWSRVRSKIRLIWCVNAIRQNAGYETLGNSYRDVSIRISQNGGENDRTTLRTMRTAYHVSRVGAKGLRGIIGIGRVGSSASPGRGCAPDGGVRHSAPAGYGDSDDARVAPTALDVYDVAMENVPLPSLVTSDESDVGVDGEGCADSSAKRRYLEEEARHVASIASLAAFAAQQTAARVDGLAREIDGGVEHLGDGISPGITSQRATDAAVDDAAEQLLILLRRVTAHLEYAGERIATHVGDERRMIKGPAEVRELL